MATMPIPDHFTTIRPYIKKRLIILTNSISILVVVAGILVLVGWLLDIELLKRVSEDYVAMNPLTAVCFILCGVALWLLVYPSPTRMRVARLISLVVLGVCAAKFVSVFTDWNYALDRLLFSTHLAEIQFGLENRMAPNTALCFVLAALALMLLDVETSNHKRPAQFFSILVTLISLLSLYGYIYDVRYLIGFAAYIPMALHTALLFLLLAVGILFSRPDKGTMFPIFCEETGQKLFTRLSALVVPLLVGWVKLQGQYSGYYTEQFGTAVFALLTFAISMFLLGRNAKERLRTNIAKFRADFIFRENAHKLQSILDNTSTPIYIKNKQGQYELVNSEFERVFGVKADTIKGKTDAEVLPNQVISTLEEYDHEVLELGQKKTMEEVFRTQGKERTYITVKFPLKDMAGHINALCSIATDITDRKEAEVKLRESEQMLNAILTNLGEGVVVADATGKFIYFNDISEKILGLGITDTPLTEWSKTYGSFLPDGITPFPPEELPLARGLKGESTNEVELFVRNNNVPDGRFIKITGRPVYDKQQRIVGSVVVFRDVTNEKDLEDLINESELKLKTVLASIGEGVVVADQAGKFLLFNKTAEGILGTGAVDVPISEWPARYGLYKPDGKTLFPPEELPLSRALQGIASTEVEMLVRNEKNPHGRTIRVSGRPIMSAEGKVTAGVVDFKDVTQVKELEHALTRLKAKYRALIRHPRHKP
ncbi:PAS domain-containing protein [Pontibacter sp. CAU 1760]